MYNCGASFISLYTQLITKRREIMMRFPLHRLTSHTPTEYVFPFHQKQIINIRNLKLFSLNKMMIKTMKRMKIQNAFRNGIE